MVEAPPEHHVARLLAIDDSASIHRLLKARLVDEPLELHAATSGADGVSAARELDPDVILLDLRLPDIDGFTVLRVLKADPKVRDIPVLIVSSSWQTEDKVTSFELGAIDFVTKPFELAELRARVHSAVRQRRLIRMLAQKAQIDGMTGLWNHSYFSTRLDQEVAVAIRHDRALSLIMIDLDHFKSVNDEHGHPFGDQVLTTIGEILVDAARKSDIVCRYGGEEFAVIVPETSADNAMNVAERQRRRIEEHVWKGKPDFMVTASFGVADLDRADELNVTALVDAADRALYEAKGEGRNRLEIYRRENRRKSA